MVEGRKKTVAMMLFSAPFSSQYADHMCRLAERALEKGYNVEIFLYGDAVHAQMSEQRPKTFFPVGDAVGRLVEKGAAVYSCEICSIARGYIKGELKDGKKDYSSTKVIEGIRFCSIYGFVEMLGRADKVLSFGGS
ncbi:MAG: DsrE family protein [Methanomassiliicoccales archaeon]|nr:DsrE family protein [Methanomassiliicoccales archaeon]